MSRWPRDSQAALIKFYGTPKTREVTDNLVKVVPPWRMYYEGNPIKAITFHKKCASALDSALRKIWEFYGRSQASIDKAGLSTYGGSYNPRFIRGSKTKWSNHAYGASLDLDPDHNGFGTGHGKMSLVAVAAFKSEGARWGGDYKGRTDPMHFEFCDNGEPDRTFEEWLDFYGVKPKAKPSPVTASVDRAPHDQQGPMIEVVQRRLDAFGYHEVGEIDGKWGGKTAGALAAYKNDRHLEDGADGISDAVLDDMAAAEADGWKRPIAAARAKATVADLKEEAPEIVPAEQNKVVGTVAAGTTGVAVISQIADSADKSSSLLGKFGSLVDLIPKWAYLLAILALIAFFTWNSWRTSHRIATAYRTGERN